MENKIEQETINFYKANGPEKLYKSLIVNSIKKIILLVQNENFSNTPDKELLSMYEKFLYLYRTDGDEIYLEISKIFRKAAHKIYRLLLKKQYINKNDYFLNSVSNEHHKY